MSSKLREQKVEVEGLSIHVVEGGAANQTGMLFLHGWTRDWRAFESVMTLLSEKVRVAAIDLPGVGDSKDAPVSNDKRTLARIVRGVIEKLGLQNVTLVGHDVGGQVLYAIFTRRGHFAPDEQPNEVASALMEFMEIQLNARAVVR